MTLKPKAALVKSGFLPPGSENKRGRMSAAAIAECERLVRDEGYSIEGFAVGKALPEATAPREVTRSKPVAGAQTIADIGPVMRDEKALDAYAVIGGKNVHIGMRTVDNTCGNSLTYCGCQHPRVNHLDSDDSVAVYFKTRN